MKVSTILNKKSNTKKPKPIELIKFIDNDMCRILKNGHVVDLLEESSYNTSGGVNIAAENYDNIVLISKGETFDIIAVYDDDADEYDVVVYLGHWNDGVIG